MIDYKSTLNLPYTLFPMRGNLTKLEPEILKKWHEKKLYNIVRDAKKDKKIFILHDGPPYANGNIHLGHSVNKIIKDIVIKSKGLMGYNAPYVPGWDCHGLPIELKVEQSIGKPKNKISAAEFRVACRKYADQQVKNQKKDYIRLGILGDWENPYLTMDFNTEANIIRAFGKIVANGHLHQGVKPVHWCINCQSALAEAEVEYHERSSLSIYINFMAIDPCTVFSKFSIDNFFDSISLIVWTTTPWTLPANRAIVIHPEFDYCLIKGNNKYYIITANLVNKVMARIGVTFWVLLGSVKGVLLEKLRFHHPFMNFDVPIILSDYVTIETGTGIVHCAPGHGPEDYIIAQKYRLEIVNIVGPDGCFLPGIMPELDKLQVFKADDIIINLLRKKSSLLHVDNLYHKYPHCWRHKSPIIFRTTSQWFLSMEKRYLRDISLLEVNNIEWIPCWSKINIENMINNRPDWCISRQRFWGVPITLFVHDKTKEIHPRTIELIELVAQLVEQHGIQAWWDLNPVDILNDDAKYYRKVTDTLDVWFDSGSTHSSVVSLRPEFKGHIPDMYLEGVDQYRGWFMSSLMVSVAMYGRAPYRQVLSHGFTIDNQGCKMSKSLGNVVSPQQIVNELGADILRLWVSSTDYTSDISLSNKIINQSSDAYRRIRNTARFLLANLNGFDVIHHLVKPQDMLILDVWAVSRAKAAQLEIITAYNSYNFHNVIKRIIHFCSIEMGSFYLDVIKDRQYTSKSNSLARYSCQTALYHIIEALVRWISPIISFTANEIWDFLPGKRSEYVFTEEWYDSLFDLEDNHPLNDNFWQTILYIRSKISKIIEHARKNKIIGSSLEAKLIIYAEEDFFSLLCKLKNELHFLFMTSSVIVLDYADADCNAIQCEDIKGLKITLLKADGKKCLRCWHYDINIGSNSNYLEICNRCISNIDGLGEERKFI